MTRMKVMSKMSVLKTDMLAVMRSMTISVLTWSIVRDMMTEQIVYNEELYGVVDKM